MCFAHDERWLLGGNHLLMEEEQQKLTSQWNLKQSLFLPSEGAPHSVFVRGPSEDLADGKYTSKPSAFKSFGTECRLIEIRC